MITIGLFIYVLLTPLIKGVEPDVRAPIIAPHVRRSCPVTVPIVETVGFVVAGDTCADCIHGDGLASTCIHAWAVDAARIRKRTLGW